PPQFACWNKTRHSISSVCPGRLRYVRFQCSGADAGSGGLWMVRHPGLDWRSGAACLLSVAVEWLANRNPWPLWRPRTDRVDIVSAVLEFERYCDLSRHGSPEKGGEL